jgi:hypothetical protein
MTPKTTAEINARCAEIEGYEWRDEYRNVGCIFAPGYYDEGVLIENYSPTTKIEQALRFGKEAVSKGIVRRISVEIIPSYYLQIWDKKGELVYQAFPKDEETCARKIVETALEVEGAG